MVTIILMESPLFLISTGLVYRVLCISSWLLGSVGKWVVCFFGNDAERSTLKMIVLMIIKVDSPGTLLIITLLDILALDILALDILALDILGLDILGRFLSVNTKATKSCKV